MYRHNAVLLFADGPAPLSLHARRLVALLDVARFVDDADRVRSCVFANNDLLQLLSHPVLVPPVVGQELLQRSRRDASRQGHWLAALGGQLGKLPLNVHGEMSTGITPRKTVAQSDSSIESTPASNDESGRHPCQHLLVLGN